VCPGIYDYVKGTVNAALFVFVNRPRTMLRILHYDGTGYWLATKRLSQSQWLQLNQ
jgi:hypothetical protein